MSREELRSRTGMSPSLFPNALARLMQDGVLADRGGEVAVPAHQPALAPPDQAAAEQALDDLNAVPFSPPSLALWVQRHGLTPAVVQYLADTGRIVRINEDTVFAKEAYDAAVERIRTHLRAHQKLTVAQARDLLQSSRRYVLPLLEWLDQQRITRRVGDDRILRL